MPTEVFPKLVDPAILGGAHDPVASAAKATAAQIMAYLDGLRPDDRPGALQKIARTLRPPDGDRWLSAQALSEARSGASTRQGLQAALAALIGNSFATTLMTGKIPTWLASTEGVSGFGAFDIATVLTGMPPSVRGVVGSALKGLVCEEGAGAAIGEMIKGEKGAKAGALGQSALKKAVGCGGEGAVVGGGTATLDEGPPWLWIGLGVGGLLILGVGGYFLMRK